MTFKVKGGIQIGANVAVDSDALLQQIETTPSIRPTLSLDFAKSQTVDSRANFARASVATVIDQDGIISPSATNQPRIEFAANGSGLCEGLLIEQSTTNLLSHTAQFHYSTGWGNPGNIVVTPYALTSPDGTRTAAKVTDTLDTVSTYHNIGATAVTISPSTDYSFSIFAKAGETTNVAIYPVTSGNGASFNLSTGTVFFNDTGITGSIKPYANGWYRCTVSVTSNAAATVAIPRLYLLKPGTSYIGTGNTGVYVWGAQLEAKFDPTSHIPAVTTFTSRSSNATYQDNTDGLLKYATSNTARYAYNPFTRANNALLIENTATNLALNSDVFSGTAGITLTSNNIMSPIGTMSGTRITEDTSTARHYTSAGTPTITANTINTGSIYVKAGTRTKVYLTVGQSGAPYTRSGMIFDMITGTASLFNIAAAPILTVPFVEYVANGWWRIALATLTTTTDTTIYMEIGGADASNAVTYTGTNAYFYVWGVQMEAGCGPTSYIPTGASAVTRAADVISSTAATRAGETCTMPISSVKMKPYEGTLAIEGRYESNTFPNMYMVGLGDTTTNSLISFRMQSDNLSFLVYNAGSNQGSSIYKSFAGIGNTAFKAAAAFSNTGWVGTFDGEPIQSAGPGIGVPPYGVISIGGAYSGGVRRAYIKNVTYYPSKLSNTELISITSS